MLPPTTEQTSVSLDAPVIEGACVPVPRTKASQIDTVLLRNQQASRLP